jgi:hypothetical protein
MLGDLGARPDAATTIDRHRIVDRDSLGEATKSPLWLK